VLNCWTTGYNEESSVVYGMPKVACQIGAVEMQLPLDNIPLTISDDAAKKIGPARNIGLVKGGKMEIAKIIIKFKDVNQ
jgi:hypothetical protein